MTRAWSVRNAAIVGLIFGVLSILAKAAGGTMGDPITMAGAAVVCAFLFAGVAMIRNRIVGAK